MKKRISIFSTFLIAVLFFATGIVFSKGFLYNNNSNFSQNFLQIYTPPKGVDFSPLWKAWYVIEEKYVPAPPSNSTSSDDTKLPTDQEKLWGTISGLAQSLKDPYTIFLPPEDNKMFLDDMSGSFEGVGMEVTVKDGWLTVVSPLKNTPAYKAGIKAGDIITEIDGKSTEGMSLDSGVKLIRGPKGTPVKLKIVREGEEEPIEITIIRDTIHIPTLETKKIESDKVFVIQLYQFNAEASKLFSKALDEFKQTGYKKLVIDLRNNPGGYLDSAVDIASWFLPKGASVVSEYYGDKKPQTVHRSKGYDLFKEIPGLKVAVLVNKGSASASEILAGALKAHKKAKLIGETTFGKGSVQELVPITDDTSLKITVARWILPDGSYINKTGIKPDIKVELSEKEKERQKQNPQLDIMLNKAIEKLRGNW